jgi:MFS family permease
MNGREAGRETFWNRDFIVALSGYLFLYMSVSMFFLLPLFLGGFGPSKGRVGLIMGIHSVLAILARPVFGRAIDRRGGRRFALWGIVVLAATVPLFHLVQDAGAFPLPPGGLGRRLGRGHDRDDRAVPTSLLPRAWPGRWASSGSRGSSPVPWALLAGAHRQSASAGCSTACFPRRGARLLFLTRRPACANHPARPAPLRNVPAISLCVIAAMPVFHGAVRGTMIYFVALFGASVGIARVGPFFLVFSLAAILTRFTIADLSDRYGRKRIVILAAVIISLNLFVLSRVNSFGALVVTGFVGGWARKLIFSRLEHLCHRFPEARAGEGLAISLCLSLFDVGIMFPGRLSSAGFRPGGL